MKYFFITLNLILGCVSACCSQECRYEKYFYWCGLASISESPTEASRFYKIGFNSVSFCLGTDLDNALRIAVIVKDSQWTNDIAIRLAKGGVELEYFASLSGYNWYDDFVDSFPQYRNYFILNFNHSLRRQFLNLQIQDSTWNETYHSWRTGEIELTLDQLISGATAIRDSFVNLVKQHGFPCEKNMGYYYSNNAIRQYPIVVLLAHIYQSGDLFYRDRLSAISCDGKLRPIEVASVNKFRGFGDSSGIEQEMMIRWKRYRPEE